VNEAPKCPKCGARAMLPSFSLRTFWCDECGHVNDPEQTREAVERRRAPLNDLDSLAGLSPESRAELAAFRDHLEHHRAASAPDCRFCVERASTWYCAGGCGYAVAHRNDFCGECACEDDSSCW
jgi:hypothetical protein